MIDCHLHLQDARLSRDLPGIMETVRAAGVARLVVNGTDPGDWDAVAGLAGEIPEVLPSFGVHPWRVNALAEGWEDRLEEILQKFPEAGVGEIGLDKWIRGHDLVRQVDVFTKQWEMARRYRRPVSVHCLKAWGSLRDCLDRMEPAAGWLLHSYGGPVEMVEEFLSRGAYFSISGYFFRPEKAEKLKCFEAVPEDRILLETDAPDMILPPNLIRFPLPPDEEGKPVNHPANLSAIYEAFAAWRGLSLERTIGQVRENFQAWFFGGSDRESPQVVSSPPAPPS